MQKCRNFQEDMDKFDQIVKSHFKNCRKWRSIANQIRAVNDDQTPKTSFLFDCGKPDLKTIKELIVHLKRESFIKDHMSIVLLTTDIFVLNRNKFHQMDRSHIFVDVSANLECAQQITDTTVIRQTLQNIDAQINSQCDIVVDLEVSEDFSLATIAGYLINYPILYWTKEEEDTLSDLEVRVHQVFSGKDLLVSFSVPLEIEENNKSVGDRINRWMTIFQNHGNYTVKNFTTILSQLNL